MQSMPPFLRIPAIAGGTQHLADQRMFHSQAGIEQTEYHLIKYWDRQAY